MENTTKQPQNLPVAYRVEWMTPQKQWRSKVYDDYSTAVKAERYAIDNPSMDSVYMSAILDYSGHIDRTEGVELREVEKMFSNTAMTTKAPQAASNAATAQK